MKKYFRNFAKAIKYLMSKGYNLDLNLYKKAILRSKISVDAVYRFEETDQVSETAVLYAITINDNMKGIFRHDGNSDNNLEGQATIKKITESIKAA